MSKQDVTVGLLWHSMNSDNLGVGALTMSNIAIVEEIAAELGINIRFKVLGWTDPKPHYETRDAIEVVNLRMKDFLPFAGKLSKVVKDCDMVIDIGGGDSFTDIYGVHRIGTLLGSKFLVWMGGVPLILAPQTIGPFDKWWSRPLARWMMNRTKAVVTRDAISTKFAQEMNLKMPLLQATDVAMRLPYEAGPRADGPKRVGINVSGLLINGGYTKDNQFGLTVDYPALVRDIIRDIQARGDWELHLVGHVLTDIEWLLVEDDHRANLKLAEEFEGLVVAPKFTTPSEAKSYISGLDAFMGARMHACIAAFSSGVPVLPMAYSRKFKGVFGTLGYDQLADCKSEDADAIRAKVTNLLDNHEAIKGEVDTAFAQARARLEPYDAIIKESLQGALR